ncbi:MAG: FtsQ-type POTRA domain-containing protein [Patescibacteria group bacterium]|nr:FtsQ-type POTRA domain-containing protein [Patescibacteria group bacterium]
MFIKYRKPYRIKKKKPIFYNRFFGIFLLISVFTVLISYFLFFSQFFQVQEIIISGNERISEKEIIGIIENELTREKLGFLSSKNIFLVNIDKIKKDISDKFPKMAEVNITRSFPNTLECIIIERIKVVVFCKDQRSVDSEGIQLVEEKCFSLDQEGIAFEETTENGLNLPKIKKPNSNDKLILGMNVLSKDLVSKILEISLGLEEAKILKKEVLIISDDRINIKTLDSWEIYFNPQKDLDWQLTKLKAVLEKYIPLEKRRDLEYVELRFGNLAPFKYKDGS